MRANDNEVISVDAVRREIDRLQHVRDGIPGSSLAPGVRLERELIEQRITTLRQLISA